MEAYIGADERFGLGDQEPNQRRFKQVIRFSPALQSSYREMAELEDKPVEGKLHLEDEICGAKEFEGIVSATVSARFKTWRRAELFPIRTAYFWAK